MDEIRAKLWLIAAGLFGGFIGQFTSNEPLTPAQRAGFILAGVGTALFLIPWAASYFGLNSTEATSALSFIAGIYWKKVILKAGELIDFVKLPWTKPHDK